MSLLYNYYIQRPVVGIRLALMNINEMQGMRSGLHTRVSLEAASSSAISMSYSTPTDICWGVRSRTSSDSENFGRRTCGVGPRRDDCPRRNVLPMWIFILRKYWVG